MKTGSGKWQWLVPYTGGPIYENIRNKRRQGIKTKLNTTVKTVLNTSSGEWGSFTSGTWGLLCVPYKRSRGIKIKMKTVVTVNPVKLFMNSSSGEWRWFASDTMGDPHVSVTNGARGLKQN